MFKGSLTRIFPTLALAFLVALPAQAHTEIPTAVIGDPGNESIDHKGGGVDYEYYIGTFPVTNDQYGMFLNSVAAEDPHGLYNPEMASSNHGGIMRTGVSGGYTYEVKEGFESKPVNFVSFWDSARFVNWLTNGQPIGPQGPDTTEAGVYLLNGVTAPSNSVVRDAAAWNDGGVAVASTDEWLKAAYYDPTKGEGGGYWLFPTRSDDVPTPSIPNGTNPNSANIEQAVGTVTDVGSYFLAQSYYGTFDQGGNVWERLDDPNLSQLRGGSFTSSKWSTGHSHVASFSRTVEVADFGFRVTSLERITAPSLVPVVELRLERSADLIHWEPVPLNPDLLTDDGNLLLSGQAEGEFFRLRIRKGNPEE